MSKFTPLEERFWRYVDKSGDCWVWTGHCNAQGYGRTHTGSISDGTLKISQATHRVSWEMANGQPVPKGMHVLHSCDNPPCVNPAHLSIGTPGDNVRDCVRKSRNCKKLTAHEVIAMRARHIIEGASQRSLAKEFGVSGATAAHAIRGRNWSFIRFGLPKEESFHA